MKPRDGSSSISEGEGWMIDRDRVTQHLVELVQIDSLSRNEREIALRLKQELEALGARVVIDDAGEKVGGNTGNVIAYVAGTVSTAPPLLLSAHMDTVTPGNGVKPILDGTVVRTDGTTVLGGDDKSGIAAILEVLRVLRERALPHG